MRLKIAVSLVRFRPWAPLPLFNAMISITYQAEVPNRIASAGKVGQICSLIVSAFIPIGGFAVTNNHAFERAESAEVTAGAMFNNLCAGGPYAWQRRLIIQNALP